jgi:hypothetical protein
MQVNPAIVIAVGPLAGEIAERAQRLILRSTGHETVPAVFQFITLNGADPAAAVADAYRAATNKNAAISAEQSGLLSVHSSRVESYVIAPLDAAHYGTAAEAARALRHYSRGAISGGRNAIFLLPRRTSRKEFADLQAVSQTLESDVQSDLTFNRCFFIGDVDESGQSIGEGDVVELVARFVSLAVVSELSRHIRSAPPPFIGDGPAHKAYASFSCSTIGFDAQRLTAVLSDYLATDICRRLFADRGFRLDDTEWPDRAAAWLKGSLGEKPDGPPSAEGDGLNQDDDYNRAKGRMDKFTYGAYTSLRDNLRAYQGLLDHCLGRGVVQLEALSKEMKELKKKINEIEIRILLDDRDRGGDGFYGKEEDRFFTPAIFLGVAGLLALLATLFLGGLEPQTLLAARVVGALLILAGVVVAFLKRERPVYYPAQLASSLEEELGRLKAEYAEKNKLQNIHVELFTRLDLAHANLEGLRRRIAGPELRRERSIFDVDIIDAELARKFYDDRYKTKDDDIAAFTSGKQLDNVYQATFSMLAVKLTETMSHYCKGRFEGVGGFNLEQMFQLRKSLSSYRELRTASSPFWYPKDPAESEKIVLASIPARSPDDVRALLNDTFGAQNIKYVHGRDPFKATLVQVAYGQRLKNILGHPPSNTSQVGQA